MTADVFKDGPPVRLCCMSRHWGVLCPDNHFMCCICFDRFPFEEASRNEDGDRQDVCGQCWENENAAAMFLWLSGKQWYV